MEEIDLKDLLSLFWSKIFQIIIIVLVTTCIGAIYSYCFTTPKYTSSTTLLLVSTSSDGSSTDSSSANTITTADITLNSNLVSTYSELIKSDNVLRKVISNLGIDKEADSLKNNISVTAKDDTEVIEIKVTDEEPENAANIANEIAAVFSDTVSEIYNISNIYIVDEAEVENTPSNINHIKDMAIFALAGIIIAVMYVLILNMFDTTIKTEEDIEKGYGLPVLSSIPYVDNFGTKGGKNK